MSSIHEIEKYFKDRVEEIGRMVVNGTPWEFLCMAAFLEYLSKLVKGKDGKERRRLLNSTIIRKNPSFL